MKLLQKPVYGLIDNGIFGVRIISGIVTGIRYTEDKPVYEISFGKNTWWTNEVTESVEDLLKMINIAPLERVKDTHGLKIKFD